MIWVTIRRASFLGALAIGTASCAGEPAAIFPSGQSLFTPQYSGNWIGSANLTGVTPVVRGGCASPSLETLIGSDYGNEKVTLAISQDGNTLEARLASATTGLACTYKGTTELNTLALDAATCDAPALNLRCTDETATKMIVIGSTIQGTVLGGRLTGTLANIYNVEPGSFTRVTLKYDFSVGKP
jgi:hypothetical protein